MNVCVCTMNCFNSNISYVQCHIIYSAMTLLCCILYIMVLELYPIFAYFGDLSSSCISRKCEVSRPIRVLFGGSSVLKMIRALSS